MGTLMLRIVPLAARLSSLYLRKIILTCEEAWKRGSEESEACQIITSARLGIPVVYCDQRSRNKAILKSVILLKNLTLAELQTIFNFSWQQQQQQQLVEQHGSGD